MENEMQIKELINAFVEYRNLFTPIEQNLRSFADTYENMRSDIQALSQSFDGNIQKKLDAIYQDLSKQFEKSKDLSSQIDAFKQKTDRFGAEINKLLSLFENIENKINKIDEIENATMFELLNSCIVGGQDISQYATQINTLANKTYSDWMTTNGGKYE